jgi:hypothetical protein
MSDQYVELIGAERVASAAHTMSHAAEQMRQAAGSIDETMRQHQRFLEDWLQRFETALERQPEAQP